MTKLLPVAIALLLALSGPALAQQAHASMATKGDGHSHAMMEVDPADAPRIVDLLLVDDAMNGVNLFLFTENFSFAPELVNQAHAAGKGHAHIYIDGVKLGRLYGNAYHLTGLTPGQYRIEVTLNANDHSEYSVGGQKVTAARTIIVR